MSACEHRAGGKHPGDCIKCGRMVPAWYLTEAEARQFYDSLGLADLADFGAARLTGRPASEYSWTEYLSRDNSAGGIEECIDAAHYALFDELVLRAREAGGEIDRDAARVIRAELDAAARAAAAAVRHFQHARLLLRGLKD